MTPAAAVIAGLAASIALPGSDGWVLPLPPPSQPRPTAVHVMGDHIVFSRFAGRTIDGMVIGLSFPTNGD